MMKIASAVLVCFTASLGLAQTTSGNSGTIQGSVLDPSHAAVVGAVVSIANPVSHYDEQAVTDGQGKFELDNIPFNNYHMTVTATGFQTNTQDVSVRTPVPLQVNATLVVGTASTTVEVTAAADLVENVSTTHTDVDRALFDKLPLENQSSSLSSLVTLASPGIAADSNGLFHGLGDHASNSFSLDGQPITDQQSKVFSNQIPVDAVESMEVIEGAPPAEYGDKDSVVIVVTTRSGLGATAPHGDMTASYGSFGTANDGFDFLDGGKSWGNFISANALQTSRFLDGPEFAIMHDHGNEENFFDRIDFKPSVFDSFNINLGFTRSWFQTPNSYDAQDDTAWNGLVVNNNGIGPNGQVVGSQDQRSKIQTFNIAPTWTHLSGAHTIFTVGAYARQDQYNYYPSRDPYADLTPDLQLQTVGQNRTLTNLGLRASMSYVKGIHNLKIGANFMDTILTEKDAIGIVDPTNNAPCLNPDGSPDTNPLLTDPAGCTGQLTMNPNFIPLLGCYDLTRTGTLPGSDGCPNSTSGLYHYYGHANIRELALYVEDTITKGPWSFNLGLRGDVYDGIATANAARAATGHRV